MKRSKTPSISFELFRLFTFGGDEELVAAFGSLRRAGEVWESVRDEFLARWNLWGMPEAWWRFEAGIPDALRRGPDAIITADDAATWQRLDHDRRAYLVSRGIDPVQHRRAQPF